MGHSTFTPGIYVLCEKMAQSYDTIYVETSYKRTYNLHKRGKGYTIHFYLFVHMNYIYFSAIT